MIPLGLAMCSSIPLRDKVLNVKFRDCKIKIWNKNIYMVLIDLILYECVIFDIGRTINYAPVFGLMRLCDVMIKLGCIV